MKIGFFALRALLIVVLVATVNEGLATGQNPSASDPANACRDKQHLVKYSIPGDATAELTRAINANGILTCVAADPSQGFCHIEFLEAKVGKQLRVKDSMGSGKTDTFTFACGPGTKSCAVFQCD
jgi:hypothetical protein